MRESGSCSWIDKRFSIPSKYKKWWKVHQKLGIMETEYSIHVDEKIRKDVSAMCNLSQGIKDNTLVDVIINMYENNFTIDQIALATKKSVEEVKAIIEKRMPVLA